MTKIRVLTDSTINKIAAGEVIENPASVIKELVENSLDAGSTNINIAIKGGGRQLIRVSDNGCGMKEDDALLCLERHATSKIRNVEDLHVIDTMGFRGEAIPSIAAISKFTLITKTENDPQGTMIIVEGGKLLTCCSAACSSGTTIEVKSLFYNVPVRKKFQKSPTHDAQEILKMMNLIALGHPLVHFELSHQNINELLAPATQLSSFQDALQDRLRAVLGKEFADQTLPIANQKADCSVAGFIGLPSYHRANRTGQYLFINKRPVQSPQLSFAIKDAYGTALPAQRHPVYVLHLTLPGELVDINVHPQKREVRLRQEHVVKELIQQAVLTALSEQPTPFSFEPTTFQLPPLEPFSFEPLPPLPMQHTISEPAPREYPKPQFELFQSPKPTVQIPKVLTTIPRFIVCDPFPKGDGLFMIDQKAAHARIIFEKLQARKNAILEVQTLLIPYELNLHATEAATLTSNIDNLQAIGVTIKPTGNHSFLLESIPQIFGNLDIDTFILDLIKEEEISLSKELEKHMALAASRNSLSGNRKLSFEEAHALLRQLMECQTPHHCPMGKPTWILLNQTDLLRHFQ